MSRVGRAIIPLPNNVTISRDRDMVVVKGPKGELRQAVEDGFTVDISDGQATVLRPSETKRHKALHGLYRALISNMTKGVSEGFASELQLVGVGYRADAKGTILELSLGFSHQIFFVLPPEVKAETISEKGQNPRIILRSIDKQLLGQVAAKIRKIRPPEPYKGKGVRFAGEIVRRKAGKSSGKGKK